MVANLESKLSDLTLENYRRIYDHVGSENMVREFILSDIFRSPFRENRRLMDRLIIASGQPFLDARAVVLAKFGDLAIVAFDAVGGSSIEIVNLEEEAYLCAHNYDELPPDLLAKLVEWSDNPQSLVDHVQQLVDQLPSTNQ